MPELEANVLRLLEPGKSMSVSELAERPPGTDQSKIMAGATLLAQRGLVQIDEQADDEYRLAPGGLTRPPELDALSKIDAQGGFVSMAELPRLLGKADVRADVKWLLRKGYCTKDASGLQVTTAGSEANTSNRSLPDVRLLERLNLSRTLTEAEIKEQELEEGLALLRGRDKLVTRRRRVTRYLTLTPEGEELKKKVKPVPEFTQLTSRDLASGQWRAMLSGLRKYDPSLATAPKYPGKEHPLQRVIQEIRQAFFEMGFEEVASPTVDTAFWVFDALFQPQDHPAREMQDTFYMAEPKHGRLPDDKLVQAVARTHENGGDTGSTGWRYQWDIEKARRLVLRTHTTSASIRALAANPKPPRKVFCIGKTFRREATDQTHLAEFMQIDGIIIDEQATLATLFGTLEAFYKKMGAEEVRFRPSFFPYTEPSAEVFAKMGKLGWVEMCGSGVFRPEVTRPLGCKVPVLAWGGGVERIAMLRFGLDDIRKLYMADIDWLRQARLSG
jgi:phenylalanyl-tRNA synthetase alpha chain